MIPKILAVAFCVLVSVEASAQQRIAVTVVDGNTYVSTNDLADALKMKLEVISSGRLITFCSSGPKAICIPFRLTNTNSISRNDDTFVLQSEAESALSITMSTDGKTAIASQNQTSSTVDLSEGYNSTWPTGRGFNKGETVPDIPLVNMQGNEVRFSDFLGKRYVLYCWASW